MHEHVALRQVEAMAEHLFALRPDFDFEWYVVLLAACDDACGQPSFEKRVRSGRVAQQHAPFTIAGGQRDATAVVEVEADTVRPLLGRHSGRRLDSLPVAGLRFRPGA